MRQVGARGDRLMAGQSNGPDLTGGVLNSAATAEVRMARMRLGRLGGEDQHARGPFGTGLGEEEKEQR